MALALTGDTIVTRPLTGHDEPEYRALLELLRRADAAATNLETLFHDFEGPAMPALPALRSDPKLARDLAWAGFDLVARATNHAGDYGIAGLQATTRAVAAAGLVQAGAGASLAEARKPGVFRSPAGSVALVSAASTFPDFARATDPRGPIPGRPGINPLRLRTTHVVPKEDLERLRALARALGGKPPDAGDRLDFAGAVFSAGDRALVSTEADPGDLAAIAAQVRKARSSADHVVVSIHCHESDGLSRESPPAFLAAFARSMIDAGADAVVGHGPHVLRGIEIYRGKPILYSLGNFLFEYETVSDLPSDDYDAVDLPASAKPGDFFDRYDQGGARGYPAEPEVWESAVAVLRFRGPRLESLELHPIALGFGLPRSERGRPRLADAEVARKILDRLARLSEPFGTRIDFADGIGRVRIPPE